MRRANAVAIALATLGIAACAPRAAAPVPASETIVFSDDFSGPQLDRAKWHVQVTGFWVNDEQQAYIDDPSVLRIVHGAEAAGADGGALVVEAHPRPGFVTAEGRRFDFVSGRIDTQGKVAITYGRAAARIRLTASDGLWPAFWALGSGEWPQTGEIDIMEHVGERDWTSVALHGPGYSGETPIVNKYFFRPPLDVTGWHVYAVDWRPDELVFLVDDAVVYRATRPMIEHYGRWAFDNPKYLILNLALGGAYPAKTNGVRGPHAGLPTSTIDLIGAGKARMLVDWVRVTRR